MIKIAVLCALLACTSATYECISGAPDADDNDVVVECSDTDNKCHGAKSPAVDNNKQGYGCGACPENSADSCTDCDGSATAKCNTYVEPTYAYTCKNLSKDPMEDVACAGEPAIQCFGPKDGYTVGAGETDLAAGGCGACPNTYDATKCTTCDGEGCNGAAALFSFLAPLLALLFWLQ